MITSNVLAMSFKNSAALAETVPRSPHQLKILTSTQYCNLINKNCNEILTM